MMKRFVILAAAALALAGCTTSYRNEDIVARPGPPQASATVEPVEIGIIAINDFHGQLEPPRLAVEIPVPGGEAARIPSGGAAWLASAVEQARAKYEYNLTVSAGDLTGASQLASSLFLDEPTIGVMNRIGLDFNAVGNHEFDRGWEELVRLQEGGCEMHFLREPCAVEPDFAGANFRYLAANVLDEDGTPLFPASSLVHFGEGANRVAVGLIGLTLEETPEIVSAEGVEGLSFTDEADAINEASGILRRAGADAVIVLIHQGVYTGGEPDPNGCEEASGALLPIIERLDAGVDLIVSGHTHWAYICELPLGDSGRSVLLTSAGSYGTMLTDIRLTIDPASNSVTARHARNTPVQSVAFGTVVLSDAAPQVEPDPEIADYVATYVAAAADYSERPAGRIAPYAEDPGALGKTPFGQLIADAQLAATRSDGAVIAFMNPGGVRSALIPAADGTLTFGDLFRSQPFGNTLVTMTLTGAEIVALLESQFIRDDGRALVLLPSAGLSYDYDADRPEGSRVTNLLLNGEPIDPARDYRVTVNSFLADGGDGFTLLRQGRERVDGMGDLDALEAWIDGEDMREVPMEPRAREVVSDSH